MKTLREKISQIQSEVGIKTTNKIIIDSKKRVTAAELEAEKHRRIA